LNDFYWVDFIDGNLRFRAFADAAGSPITAKSAKPETKVGASRTER
jgi:hypothetical protein